jgi:hypothetical protein
MLANMDKILIISGQDRGREQLTNMDIVLIIFGPVPWA